MRSMNIAEPLKGQKEEITEDPSAKGGCRSMICNECNKLRLMIRFRCARPTVEKLAADRPAYLPANHSMTKSIISVWFKF